MGKRFLIIILIVFIGLTFSQVEAAPNKPKKLRIRSLRDLDFGYLYPGQPPSTVDPENPQWGMIPGELQIIGSPLLPYQVELPAECELTHGQSSIFVYNFTTNLVNNQGQLDALGESTLRIGATVGPIPATASGGNYKGRATITIYYQY